MNRPGSLCFSVLCSDRHHLPTHLSTHPPQPPTLTPTALLGSVSSGGAARSKLHIFVEWLPLHALGGEERSAASGEKCICKFQLQGSGALHIFVEWLPLHALGRGAQLGRRLNCNRPFPPSLQLIRICARRPPAPAPLQMIRWRTRGSRSRSSGHASPISREAVITFWWIQVGPAFGKSEKCPRCGWQFMLRNRSACTV